MQKNRILAVDDSKMNQKVIAKLLESEYELSFASSGVECLEKVAETKPDLVLLDVTMPDLDGYETCLRLRQIDETAGIPILFLSGRCSVEEKLKGYQVGGDDYLTKPFEGEEVLIKIRKSLSSKFEQENLKKQAKNAEYEVSDLAENYTHLGSCIYFFENSFSCSSFQQAADCFFKSMAHFGLASTILLHFSEKKFYYSYGNSNRELEIALLGKFIDQGRYVSFGKRLIINYGHVALLIKNMPEGENDRISSIKEHTLILVKGLDACVASIHHKSLADVRQRILELSIKKTHEFLQQTDKQFLTVMKDGASCLEDIIQDLEQSTHALNFDDYQEKGIQQICERYIEKSNKLFSQVWRLDHQYSDILEQLEKLN